jgi:competence protein ComEC
MGRHENHLLKPPPLRELIWESPLVPVAIAVTAGLVLDRYLEMTLAYSIAIVAGAAIAWLLLLKRKSRFAPFALWVAAGGLAGNYHHLYRNVYPGDDIGNFATAEAKLVRVRGVLDEEPTLVWLPHGDPLASFLRPDPTRGVLDVREIRAQRDWLPVSGKARLTVQGHLDEFHVGDEVEVVGWLAAPSGPDNPGEWDRAEYLHDKRIRADLFVRKTPDAVLRRAEGWTNSFWGWLAQLRGWGQRAFARTLPKQQAAIASALLLGENATMTSADWDKYIRTGVIHVLAISGQHLVVLAGFLWFGLRIFRVRSRRGAIIVALFLLGYALLTGFRPPVQRAAVAVGVYSLGTVFRRAPLPANTFALSWLVVIALNPADPFGVGCQLAFLQVAMLSWGISRWLDPGEEDPIDRLIDETRTRTERVFRGLARGVGRGYAITLILGLASMPLVAAWQHLVSLSGFVIGPPMILLTSIALISGFLLLLSEALGGFFSPLFAFVTRWSLSGCDGLVDLAERMPFSHVYVPDIPPWLIWVFYLVLLSFLWLKPLWPRQRWLLPAGAAWLCFALIGGAIRSSNDELNVTFLAVGHGGCTVIETPDGRTLLYDAGALGGPDVTRRHIAPYLWWRGKTKIDELFLSHADLDHFNGVVELLERFEVGLITLTPSFSQKELPGVRHTLAEIERRKVPARIVRSGEILTAGDVTLEVLHPPEKGPEGNENTRSLVLKLHHAGHTILLTGDLEGAGMNRVVSRRTEPVDVLMAPHHGSKTANTPSLAEWAKPTLVVSCEGPPLGAMAPRPDPYTPIGATVWGTYPHGAVIIRSGRNGLTAETYKTKQKLNLP